MADTDDLTLIHAEIDGELDVRQRGELARRLLTEPDVRSRRDQLQRLCALLDAAEEVEPPLELRSRILDSLPSAPPALGRTRRSVPWWRHAALAASLIAAAVVAFETLNMPRPTSTELVGTIAAGHGGATLDTVSLPSGPVAGRVSLYRDAAGLGLRFELMAATPVEVLAASDGRALRVKGLGSSTGTGSGTRPSTGSGARPGATSSSVALPGFGGARTIDLTFLMGGRAVGRATLTVPDGR